VTKQAVKGKNPHIYRMALSQNANHVQRRDFEKKIEAIQRVNPAWVVMSDWVRPGEKEAYVMIRKDKDYASRRVLHLMRSHLSRVIVGDYGDKR
jgi:hypothetical protein